MLGVGRHQSNTLSSENLGVSDLLYSGCSLAFLVAAEVADTRSSKDKLAILVKRNSQPFYTAMSLFETSFTCNHT